MDKIVAENYKTKKFIKNLEEKNQLRCTVCMLVQFLLLPPLYGLGVCSSF